MALSGLRFNGLIFFDVSKPQEEKIKKLSVLQTIEIIENRFKQVERIKNGKVITGSGNVDLYRKLRNSLSEYTLEKYKRKLSIFFFEDIDAEFFEGYAFFLQKRGIENGNKAEIVNNLKTLRATLNHADKMKIPCVNTNAYLVVEKKMQRGITSPKTIPYQGNRILNLTFGLKHKKPFLCATSQWIILRSSARLPSAKTTTPPLLLTTATKSASKWN
jgi:hypothetical protein